MTGSRCGILSDLADWVRPGDVRLPRVVAFRIFWPVTAATAGNQQQEDHLRMVLWDDLVTEYDARLYSAFLHGSDISFTDAFRRVEKAWADDEDVHHQGFANAYRDRYGPDDLDQLGQRQADFGPIAHLFEDEFAVCVLNCYDELVTLRGYRANRHIYAPLGPDFGRFVDGVIADEARHFGNYLWVIRTCHQDRVPDAERVLDRVFESTWAEYMATFVLDHDDPVYDDAMMREARDVLLRQVARPNPVGYEPTL